MADNVTIPASGNGTATPVVATDDVSGVHFQKVKLDVGADGASDPVSGSLPVDDNGGSLTVDGTVAVSNFPATQPVSGTGNVAHDAVDAGNPVKIGGKYVAAPGAVADGDRTDALSDSFGRLQVGAYLVDESGSGGTFAVAHSDLMVDGKTNSGGIYGRVLTASDLWVFNGTTWDRLRGDTLGIHVSRQATAATATLSNVNDTATSTTLLAANTSRKGASIHNDSTAVLYVKFGTTASATSFTVKMAADAHYEVPFGFTGRIDGIWASDASGAARITELT